MGETPDGIREEIEQTRARMGETVEAIGYKTDVKARAKDSLSQRKDAVVGSVASGKDAVVGATDALVARVSGAVPGREEVLSGARKVGVSAENPFGVALAGAAAGFILGTLIPSTQVEDAHVGPLSDQVGEKAKEAGQEALDRTKDVAQDALGAARETVENRGGDEAQELAASLRDKAQEVSSGSVQP